VRELSKVLLGEQKLKGFIGKKNSESKFGNSSKEEGTQKLAVAC
jgi:hypothetical protein